MNQAEALAVVQDYLDKRMNKPGGDQYFIIEDKIRKDVGGWFFPLRVEPGPSGEYERTPLKGSWGIFVQRDGKPV